MTGSLESRALVSAKDTKSANKSRGGWLHTAFILGDRATTSRLTTRATRPKNIARIGCKN